MTQVPKSHPNARILTVCAKVQVPQQVSVHGIARLQRVRGADGKVPRCGNAKTAARLPPGLKTRGKHARHQAARVDQSDIILSPCLLQYMAQWCLTSHLVRR